MKVNSFKSILVFLFLVFVTEVCFAERAFLGVDFIIKNNKLTIDGVYYDTPAYKYGLQKGDILEKYQNTKITDVYNFLNSTFIINKNVNLNKDKLENKQVLETNWWFNGYSLKDVKIGDTLNLEILRNGKLMTKNVKIEDIPHLIPFYDSRDPNDKEKNRFRAPISTMYNLGEEVFLWSYSSKLKKWISEIPTLNDSNELKLDKTRLGKLENDSFYTNGGHILYTPKSHKVSAIYFYGENFTGNKCSNLGITEKAMKQISDYSKFLPKVEFINENLGNRYIFYFPIKTPTFLIVRAVLNDDNNGGHINIVQTSSAMNELFHKELAQVEKYTDFNKKERNVPTQLGGYRLGDVPIAKKVKDREKGIFEANGEFKFNSDGYSFLRHDNFLYFMSFGESGGAIGYTPKSHRIHEISLCYNKFSLETVSSEISNNIKNLLENDVKEIENRLGIKAVREAEDRYVLNFPSKSKTKLIVDVFKTLNQDAATYALMTGQREDMYGNKLSLAYGFIQLTLTSDEMTNIFNKEKAEILAIQKAKEDKAKEKKKQQDSAFGLN